MGRRAQRSKRHRRQRPKWKHITYKYTARCWCGKVIFPDKISADMALTRGAGRKGSIRSYECDVAPGNWHTTSQEYEEWLAQQELEETPEDEE